MRHKSQKKKKRKKKKEHLFIGCNVHTSWNTYTILHYTDCVHPKLIPPISHLLLYLIYTSHFTLLQSNDFHKIRGEIKGLVKEIKKKRLK